MAMDVIGAEQRKNIDLKPIPQDGVRELIDILTSSRNPIACVEFVNGLPVFYSHIAELLRTGKILTLNNSFLHYS